MYLFLDVSEVNKCNLPSGLTYKNYLNVNPIRYAELIILTHICGYLPN